MFLESAIFGIVAVIIMTCGYMTMRSGENEKLTAKWIAIAGIVWMMGMTNPLVDKLTALFVVIGPTGFIIGCFIFVAVIVRTRSD